MREGKDFNNQNGGAHGLAILFQKNHQLDSAVKYSLYSYTMNDSVYARMATNEIERARGLYDYTRIQEMAQKEEKRANAEHNKVLSACFVLFIVITPKEIANMLDVSSAYITKLRNNMMVKLFGEEGKSKELDERLMQYS